MYGFGMAYMLFEVLILVLNFVADTFKANPLASWDTVLESPLEDREVMAMRVPLDSENVVLLYDVMGRAARSSNMHKHTYTCKKGGRKGDHSDCRMGYDRPLVETSHCLNDTLSNVVLKRTHGNLVAFMPVLMLAMPGNHFMSMTNEHGRGLREYMLWEDKRNAGLTNLDAPELLDPEVHSIIQSEYAAKYSTKADNTNINTTALLLIQEHDEMDVRTLKQQSRSLMAKMINKIHGSITYPLVLVTSFLLGHDDHWFPMPCEPFNPWPFYKTCMAFSLNNTEYDECHINFRLEQNPNEGSVTISSSVSEYRRRHIALQSWSPIEMIMAFKCGKPTTIAGKLLQLDSTSNEDKLGHSPVPHIRIPQIIQDIPPQPEEASDNDSKEKWAAYVLGCFYPFDRQLQVLKGTSLWEKVNNYTLFIFVYEHM